MDSDIRPMIVEVANMVYMQLGPFASESVYRNAMVQELRWRRGVQVEEEKTIFIIFRDSGNQDVIVGSARADIVVNQSVVVELKAVAGLRAEHEQQCKLYMKHLQCHNEPKGLLINFPQRLSNAVEYSTLQ